MFVVLWVVFCTAIGLVAAHRPASIAAAAVFTAVCALVAIVFDGETAFGPQVLGLVIRVRWRGSGGVVANRAGADPGFVREWVLGALVAVGVVGTGAMLASRALARRVYRVWMDASAPIGWTVSTVLLGVVYFVVITPMGVVMRVFGYDPMARGFDGGRASYWEERDAPGGARRYFRQF
ncbi:MAG: SxtJ family membrane protein [Phycisphaerales bacterium]